MNGELIVVVEHLKGSISEITFEMLGKGREIADLRNDKLTACLLGNDLQALAGRLGMADLVLTLEHPALAEFNPDLQRRLLADLLAVRKPGLVFIASTSMGMEFAGPLSGQLEIPTVSSCRDIVINDGEITVTSQQYGGKILIDVKVGTSLAILSILPGAFPAQRGLSDRPAVIEQVRVRLPDSPLRTEFLRMVEPGGADIDITKAPVLVSVGRGIQNDQNLPLATELAELLGGAVSASRPVIDQGWLPMTRQVGRSGMIVKPRAYLALGISGAPEHVEGMRGAELIIACNTDPAAPIFSVAHYGVVADALELIPALTEELRRRS